MKRKILICGATGFIGRNMVEFFSKNSAYEVHAVRFNRAEYVCENVHWHCGDLRNPAFVDQVVNGVDVIVQAAATTSGAKDIVTRPFIHVTDNAIMNSYLLRSAFEHGVKHFIFFSCTVMYPSSSVALKESDFDENADFHPRYFGVGNTEIYIEKMCDFFSRIGSMKCTAIRHSNIYGPYDKFDLERSHVFGATVTKVMREKDSVTIWGTGEEERDLLYVDDLLDFVGRAIDRQQGNYRLYNCGVGEAVSIKKLVEIVVELSGKNLRIEHDLSQPTIKTSLFLDCSLARSELGWSPVTKLRDGVKKTLMWWKEKIDPETLRMK